MMDMQVTGIKKDILQISTADFSLYISGNTQNKKYNSTNNKNVSGQITVETNLSDLKIQTINSFGQLEENNTSMMVPSFFEDGIYDLYLESNTNDLYEVYHHNKEIRENISYRGRNAFGAFKFNGDIGYSTFYIRKNNENILSFTIQVFPTKLDYMDDYKELLKDINEEITSLVFDFMNKTFSNVNIIDVKNQTGVEFIAILHNIYEKLERAIKRIEKHPKHGVFSEYNLKDKDKSKKVAIKETLKYIRKNSSDKVIEVKKHTTLDIYENQYVKYMIKRVIKRIKDIKQIIKESKGEDNTYYEILS